MSLEVLPVRHQRIRAEPAEAPVAQQLLHHVDEVDEEDADEQRGRHPVDQGEATRRRRAPGQRAAPSAVCGEQRRGAGQHQRHGDQGESQVGDAPADREALEELLARPAAVASVRTCGTVLRCLAILLFAVIPQAGMQPEEGEHADQQGDHEFRWRSTPADTWRNRGCWRAGRR